MNIAASRDDVALEITEIDEDAGWPSSEVGSLDDCDRFVMRLTRECSEIEYFIDAEEAQEKPDRDWLARAVYALRVRKGALHIVNNRQKVLQDIEERSYRYGRDRMLLEYIRKDVGEARFNVWIEESGCELRVLR